MPILLVAMPQGTSVISGVAILGFELLLLLVSLSVIVFFRDRSRHCESWWSTKIAPAASVLTFGASIGYTATHLELLTGSSSSLTPVILFCFSGAFLLGLGYAPGLPGIGRTGSPASDARLTQSA